MGEFLDFMRETLKRRLYMGDCTRETVQGRVKQKDLNQNIIQIGVSRSIAS